jgi:tetratricopeptide (TPR) repeat protein
MRQSVELEALAEAHLVAGRPETAAELCEIQIHGGPPSIVILRVLTAACERLGRMERAYEVALKWASLAPFDAYAHYKLGMLEQGRGQFREALSRYSLVRNIAGEETDIGHAAEDAMQTLDLIQLLQISALAEIDIAFRKGLMQDVREAVEERGFMLSHRGLVTVAQAAAIMDQPRGKPLGGTYYQ